MKDCQFGLDLTIKCLLEPWKVVTIIQFSNILNNMIPVFLNKETYLAPTCELIHFTVENTIMGFSPTDWETDPDEL